MVDADGSHHNIQPHNYKKLALLTKHSQVCNDESCDRWYRMVLTIRQGTQYRFISTDRPYRINGTWSYAQPCPVAKEIYDTHYGASKNAHKKNQRRQNRQKRGKNKRYDTERGPNTGKVIPRRSWKLAIAAFRVVAFHLSESVRLGEAVYDPADTTRIYYVIRATCKELSVRLPMQLPSIRNRVVSFRLQYLNILRIDQRKRRPCPTCGGFHHVPATSPVQDANLLSLHSVLTCNTMLTDDMRRDIYYKTRMYAAVAIQRWWRRNAGVFRSRHCASAATSIPTTTAPSYIEMKLKDMAEEKRDKHQMASTQAQAFQWRKQGRRKNQRSPSRADRNPNWRSDKSEA